MGHWAGTQTSLLCLALLLLQLFACCCQGLQNPAVLPTFYFTYSLYNATVYENSAARTYANSKVKMGVTLTHKSWDIKYRIVSGDEEGFFKAEEFVMGDFCFLRVRTKGGNAAILNREIQDNYLLTVKATVRGEDLDAWAKVNIQVLDMNDLRPLFSPTTYSVTIAENTPLRTSIAQVTATDADIGSNGEFYYFFKDKVDLFAVHPTSGVISLSGRLNSDERNRYDLEILAVDRGMKLYGNNGVSSTAKLFIHIERINEHAPTLSVVTHTPSLLDKDPTYAVLTVEDMDEGANGEIESVSIVAGDPLDQFRLVKRTGSNEYRIKGLEPVDWDHFPYGYNLTLQAKDKGSPQKFSAVKVVHVYVNRPQAVEIKFEKEMYEVSLSEFSPPGVIVVAVKLSPEPQDVEYNLNPGPDSDYFKINPQTGLITTARHLNILEKELFELQVVDLESDLKVKVSITVEDENNHAPLFLQPSYEVFLNESIAVGTNVLTVSATDSDKGENGYITYSIASIQALPFTINQFTGVISSNNELDFESSSESYIFVVRASDWGSPYRRESEVNVTVHLENVNDNKPLFEKIACQGVISYSFPPGEQITTVSAIDIDELELVKYKIISGNEKGFFELNPDSGVLVLRKSLTTANPKNGVFNLKIAATDGENLSDSMFVNISIVHGKVSSKSFSCNETRVAQKLAEKLLKKAKANSKPKIEDVFIDLYSVNRQTPQFDKSFPSEISVCEDLKIGGSVLKVKAWDGDTGFNGRVLFTISDGNKDSCFNIDMETGLISVLMPMDREKVDRYLLNITIYDLGSPQKSTWRLLTINVEDANDNTPQFLQESYSAVILENTNLGTAVIQVEATDKDFGPNGDILYSILTSTTQLAINSSTGIVYVAGQLDREFKANFNLKIEARDKAERGKQRFSVVTLKVSLDDVNDCPPAFIPYSYNAKVLEDLPVGTIIAWLETQDPDLGLGGQVRYTLANDYNGKFEIDKASGVIRLAKELDYEKQQFYNLTVRAKDKGRPVSLLSVSFVEVEVVDVNENLYPPYFLDFAVKGTVKENSRIGTSVLQVTARDDDVGRDGEIQYSIRDGSGLGRFSIDEETAWILLVEMQEKTYQSVTFGIVSCCKTKTVTLYENIITSKPRYICSLLVGEAFVQEIGGVRTKGGNAAILNREIQDNYLLTVKATVRGEDLDAWAKVNIQVLDMNDLRPLFSPTTYSVTIAENTPLRTSIAQVTATDADIGSNGEFYYFFKDKVDLFAVHPTSGVISLSGRLNSDERNRYDLEILAVDRGMKLYGNNGVSSTAKLFIHIERINEHAPTLSVVTHTPSLLDKDPTYAVLTVEDMDEGANGEIESVSIVAGDPLDQFRLVKRTGSNEYRIKGLEPVDWDHFPYGYNLTLQAKDKGSPQKFSAVKVVHVYVNRPQAVEIKFEKEMYEVSLSEFSPPGVIVVAVKLSPEPQDVEYNLNPGPDSDYFKINPQTGLITTARHLNILEKELFELQVVDLESDLKVKVSITVEDENNHAPLFLQPSYEVFLNESIAVGTNVLTVSATDSDKGENGYITYSIASIQALPFTINQFTGVISSNNELDFESSSESYIFVVRASDWGSPYRRESEVNVTVHLENVNDNKPLFEKIACQGVISYSFPPGEQITTVSAIDIDELELVKYKIISGNEKGFFELNPDSGVLVLRKSLTTANPKNGVFNLKIAATDGENLSDSMFVNISIVHGKVSSKSFSCNETRVAQKLAEKLLKKAKANSKPKIEDVFIDLYSVNRQTPQFDKSFPSEISVCEDLKIGGSVLKVKAWDGDTGFNGRVLFTISDGNKDSCFNIDMETGLISVLMPMDREKVDRYLLNITIYDLGSPQKSTWRLLTINVEDANDNTPQFLQESYSAVILENTNLGTAVIQVEATDKDFGPNGDILYSILTSTTQLAINSSTGIVYVAGQLDREFKANFNLKIEARDKAERGKQRFSVVTLKVSLDDVNDCPPAFIPYSYNAKVLEDLPVGTIIAWLETQDPDLGLGGQVRYTLANDYNGKFEIDKASGVIRLAKELDYEKQQFYNLTVRAKDKGRPVSLLSVSFVEVEVVDVNENLYPPYFLDFAVKGTVKENSRIGTSVLQVTARDDDVGRDGEIQYSIRDGSGLGRFSIDEETAWILLVEMQEKTYQSVTFGIVSCCKTKTVTLNENIINSKPRYICSLLVGEAFVQEIGG
ncbi:UNVERIFIED_CONTAM: hypothetical protein FKN15_032003 [Acipenser sinensis]